MRQQRIVAAVCALALLTLCESAANAATLIPGGTYTSNVTWTTAGSPYIINGNLTVGAGATLTIDPGVVVKLNGLFRTIYIDGRIVAAGTAANRITFTSYHDDIGGDSDGNGPSIGLPGDWLNLHFRNNSSGNQFAYVDVLYGGYGSADQSYGAIKVSSGATITLDHITARRNQRSGLLVGVSSDNPPYAGASVTHSDFLDNGNGISVNTGWLSLSGDSFVASNSKDGVWFNLASNYTGPTTYITRSQISDNGRHGIYYNQISLALLPGQKPHGDWNNIFGNGDKHQLYTLFSHHFVHWTHNYWGDFTVDVPCLWAPFPEHPAHVQDLLDLGNPPEGPIASSVYVEPSPPNPPPEWKPGKCRSDHVVTTPSEREYIDNSGF
jgi:hypothetical protein